MTINGISVQSARGRGMLVPVRDGQETTIQLAQAPWMSEVVSVLARELRLHHAPTADHSHRLAALSRVVADRMHLDALDATEAELVAVLHDVGKLTIPPSLLDWPGSLDPAQRARMRRHTIEGEQLLARTAGLEHLGGAVRATHEAWDGSGYPDGLAGEKIPLSARIVACADSYDAMVSDRAYRRALSPREAGKRITEAAGAQFDPAVAKCLLAAIGHRRTGRFDP
jgi:HD-GYP domain-containing protein (c-di-GMP phosphodiesterase class II)